MAATLTGVNSQLVAAFNAMVAASPYRLGISSGFRSRDEQQRLYDAYLRGEGNLAAKPGSSNHESGFAIDIDYPNDNRSAAAAWVRANAARFGLALPVRGEDWHLELAGKGKRAGGLDDDTLRYNLAADAEQKPEDVLSARLESIMGMLTGGTPSAETPADMTAGMGTDVTMLNAAPAEAPTARASSSGGGGDLKSMVRQMAEQMGWGPDQWPALEELVQRESSWNPTAQNPTSTAFGLFQFLDSTWKNYGTKTSDPAAQAQAGLAYIRDRYGDPRKALAFHDRKNWY